MKSSRLLLIFCLVVVVAAAPVQAVPEREIAVPPLPGGDFVVTLNMSGIAVGGVVETIPDGFTFLSTTHPPGRVSIKGQQISFVVLNDTSIRYRVRAPDAGSGTFTGVWEDFLQGTHGVIGGTEVTVGDSPGEHSGNPTKTPGLSGWTVGSALCALGAVSIFRRRSA